MKISKNISGLLFVLLASSLLFISCNNNVSGSQPISQPSKVKGRVANSSSSGGTTNASATNLGGMTVVLAQVQSDGTLKTVSTANATTQADGSFVVSTDLDGINNLIVEAKSSSGTTYKAIVDATVHHGMTVTAPPLTSQSTTQSDVYQDIVAKGQASAVSTADIELYVDAKTTARVWGNNQAIASLASAIIARDKAQASVLSSTAVNASAKQIQTIEKAKMSAAADLQTAINAANSDTTKIDDAYNTYFNAVIKAYTNAGLNTNDFIGVNRTGNSAYLNVSSSLSSQTRFDMKQNASLILAEAMQEEAQEQFQAAGATQSEIDNVNQASVQLQSDIKSATDISGIVAAFTTFHDSLKASLKATLSADASEIDTIDTDINAQNGIKAKLESTVSGVDNASIIATAYATYFNSVKTEVKDVLSTATQTDIDVSTKVLTMINMQF